MAERPEHIHYINSVLIAKLDRSTLKGIYSICAPRKKFCLVGFNDYTKHIVNLLPTSLEYIIDNDPKVKGIKYRNFVVVGLDDIDIESNVLVFCKYEYISEYTAMIKEKYPQKTCATPSAFSGKATRFANYFEHDSYHRYIFANEDETPASMMGREKLMFLCELMRSTANLEGTIAEFGVWQGGSAFLLMRGLKFLGRVKKVLLFDLFEGLEPKYKEAIMCDDEIERKLSFYGRDNFRLVKGDMNEKIHELENEVYSFIHYDLGFHPPTLKYIYDRLVPGGILILDNYGFATASPQLYKNFFQKLGGEVMSVPFSEQGFLIKRS